MVILIIAFTWIKWDIWFYNPPEPTYTPSLSPARIMLTWSDNPFSSRDVTWEGDTSSHQGFLQISGNATPGDTILYRSNSRIIKSSGGSSAFFNVHIKDLRQGQLYHYRVSNNKIWSDWFDFKIGNSTDASYSFVYFGAAVLLSLIGIRRFSDNVNDTMVLWGVGFEAAMLLMMFFVMLFTPDDSITEDVKQNAEKDDYAEDIIT